MSANVTLEFFIRLTFAAWLHLTIETFGQWAFARQHASGYGFHRVEIGQPFVGQLISFVYEPGTDKSSAFAKVSGVRLQVNTQREVSRIFVEHFEISAFPCVFQSS